MLLGEKLKSDEKYAKFHRIVKNSMIADIDGLTKEVETLHSTRNSRLLSSRSVSTPDKLSAAHAQDTSYRSRLVEILISVTKELRPMQMALTAIVGYLTTQYYADLPFRSKGDKESYLRAKFLKPAIDRIERLETLHEICNLVIVDIDKTAWSLKSMADDFSLATKREHAL